MTALLDSRAIETTQDTDLGDAVHSKMQVLKRNGQLEEVNLNKIVKAVERCSTGLDNIDPMRVAIKTVSGVADGMSTIELDTLSIRTAASLITEEPSYSKLAARLLSAYIDKEVRNQGIQSFSQSVKTGADLGLIADTTRDFVLANARKLDDAIRIDADMNYEFFGLRTVYDRYLLKNPTSRKVFETPQYFKLRVACGLSQTPDEAIELYKMMREFKYLPGTPTLFNSGTTHPQMSSCYLLDSPEDDLGAIYDRYKDIALLSKHAGGIGTSWSRVRSRGSLIKGTNGLSNGTVPFLKTLDSSIQAVNQGGRRKGAACVYLATWHADIEEFLELRDNTGDESRRTHHLNLSHWIPDLFMERVEADGMWSLFDPAVVPELVDEHNDAFRKRYTEAEDAQLYAKQVKARDLYGRMMRTLAETGNGWMCFSDKTNRTCNQAMLPQNTVHLSNLCTEICEVTDKDNTAVCNLGSLNLGTFVNSEAGKIEWEALREAVRVAVKFLDRVIDINFYPTDAAANSNSGWRPIGLGVMGLQDVFFKMRIAFDSDEAKTLSTKLMQEIYLEAVNASITLAEEAGSSFPRYDESWTSAGKLQPDLWGINTDDDPRWDAARLRMEQFGIRNSLLLAIAPTATIASISGCYECIEPAVSNLFKRETLSGEFLQINSYLVRDLQALGLWDSDMVDKIKAGQGSIQDIEEIPAELKNLYRTAWEIPMRSLIDLAAARGPFLDQSQSLNLFIESPTIGKLSSMYAYAWKQGLKTTYYLRSRPATRITASSSTKIAPIDVARAKVQASDADAITCSLENPDACESCQ